MAIYKAAVAYNRHFFLVDSATHLAAKTGLGAGPVVNISKAGAAFGAAAGAISEIGNGWYRVALTIADTGTTGDLLFHITAAGADDTDFADQVVSYDPFDAVALGLSRIDAAVSTRMATFALPANFATLVIDANGRVDLSKWLGAAVNALIAGRVDSNAQVVGDKTGYTASTVSDKTGYTVSTNQDKTGYGLAVDAVDSAAIATTGAQEIANALLDLVDAIETGVTPRQAIRLMAAVIAGNATGLDAASGIATFRGINAPASTRVSAVKDGSSRSNTLTP